MNVASLSEDDNQRIAPTLALAACLCGHLDMTTSRSEEPTRRSP